MEYPHFTGKESEPETWAGFPEVSMSVKAREEGRAPEQRPAPNAAPVVRTFCCFCSSFIKSDYSVLSY